MKTIYTVFLVANYRKGVFSVISVVTRAQSHRKSLSISRLSPIFIQLQIKTNRENSRLVAINIDCLSGIATPDFKTYSI